MVIVLALFDEDTLGELQVKTGNVKSLWHIKYFSDVFCHMVLDPFLTECLKKKKQRITADNQKKGQHHKQPDCMRSQSKHM